MMRLRTKRLVLRDLKGSDAEDLRAHANDLEVSRHLLMVPHPYSLKNAREFIALAEKEAGSRPREEYEFGITLKGQGRIIGMIGITSVNRFHGTATIGYWLGQKHWRNGYMNEALERALQFSFTTLKLNRINISAFVENEGSNALIKRVGFKYEGSRRQYQRDRARGKLHDENIYGMLREDYLRSRKD